jgi:hypothetical protein
MMPRKYPRILFVTPCAFNQLTGGGITFSNLFRDWPSDKLATVTDDLIPVSREICQKYFFLTPSERNYIRPFHLLKKSNRRPNNVQIGSVSVTLPSLFVKIVKHFIGDAGIPDCGILSPELFRWIKEYNPEVIYTILGTKGYIELVDQIHKAFPVPLIIHLMDDGVTDPHRRGFFGSYLRKTYARKLTSLLPKTSLRMAICEMMAREYESRYGMDFIHIQNTIDVGRWKAFTKSDLGILNPVRIAYIGSILPFAQTQSLLDICKVVKRLNDRGEAVALDIYTPKEMLMMPPASFEIHPGIKLHEAPASDEDLFRIMFTSDLLVLPVNFDDTSIHFIRLSMPTKIPAYLTSGTPILVYGPKGIAQVEYARNSGWGFVIDTRGLEHLERGLSELIANSDLRCRLSLIARDTAEKNHDDRVVRTNFQKALIALAPHE